METPPAKRQCRSAAEPLSDTTPKPTPIAKPTRRPSTPAVTKSLFRAISPPPKKTTLQDEQEDPPQQHAVLSSPWQLTWIRDLPAELNRDAVTLRDILGDPLIAEVWIFNFLHDVKFIMEAFDEDTRALVSVHLVHGFWKRDDASRLMIEEQASSHPNMEIHIAPMPQMFGTHHSKMMILFRIDDTAQVVIHTANMISRDWTNLTIGLWRSPRLPRVNPPMSAQPSTSSSTEDLPIGSGGRFKADLITYLGAYNTRRPVTRPLVAHLRQFDFSTVRAALIASVPGRHNRNQALWGWPALKRTLAAVPCADGEGEVVAEISSIATLGPKDAWLKETLFGALGMRKDGSSPSKPNFRLVFPTADEIRSSLDGYLSGGSIHTKIQSAQQAKQLEYLRPYLHHWANDCDSGKKVEASITSGGRERAAAHIKTYIRYGKDGTNCIDWALLTSANLSKQAWGEAGTNHEVRIASWEIGVLVWPELLTGCPVAKMVGTFKTDHPDKALATAGPVIGLRVPYNLPLQGYGPGEVPWVATLEHKEPDRFGMTWTHPAG